MNGFRLDRRRDAMKGGTLAMIGPGNAAGSRMYLRLTGNQFGMQMPPTGALKPEQIEVIKAWIDQGAEWPDDVSGDTPATAPDPKATRLMQALRAGDSQGFRKALAEAPKAANLKGPGGSTPLMYAALYSDTAAVRTLLDKHADPNVRNDSGATALMWSLDDADKTRLLLEHGADVNAKSSDGRTPLLIAASVNGNSAVLKLLLDRGADVSAKAPALVGDTTALTQAALVSDEAMVRMLLDRGADPKGAGPLGLALSMRAGCGWCMDLFLKNPEPDLVMPTMFLVSPPFGPAFGVAPLLQLGGDANAKDPQGNAILALAAASDAVPVPVVEALLHGGADVNGKSFDGYTALELAKRQGATPVVDLLVKAGAKEVHTATDPVVRTKPAASARAAVERSLPLLQQNDASFLRKSGCVSCHNNTLVSLTVSAARKSGIRVDEQQVQQQKKTIGTYLESWRERALQNEGIPGDTDTMSYILVGLAAVGYSPDPATDAMALFMKRNQLPDGHWKIFASRPPLESSDIQVTAVAMRALQAYAPKARQAEFDKAVALAAGWLKKAQPMGTEDRAFQILGLAWAGENQETIRTAASALIAAQRADGGWSQIPALPSDAYATGEVLAALLQSGILTPGDPVAKRGLQFLMNNQAEDGTWYVKRRAVPIQPYFESGFPYGHDQFISAAATNWATTALAMAARTERASR